MLGKETASAGGILWDAQALRTSSLQYSCAPALRDRYRRKTSPGKGIERSQQGQVAFTRDGLVSGLTLVPHFNPKTIISVIAGGKAALELKCHP